MNKLEEIETADKPRPDPKNSLITVRARDMLI